MTPAFFVGTIVCCFLTFYIFFTGITWRDWTRSKKEFVECWFQMSPAISLLLTVFMGLSLIGGHFTSVLFDPAAKSKTHVTEMIVQELDYHEGKLYLRNAATGVVFKADSKWEDHKFPTNIKYVITHRDGELLSCYPKEQPALVPSLRIKIPN